MTLSGGQSTEHSEAVSGVRTALISHGLFETVGSNHATRADSSCEFVTPAPLDKEGFRICLRTQRTILPNMFGRILELNLIAVDCSV